MTTWPSSISDLGARVATLDRARTIDDVYARMLAIETTLNGYWNPAAGGPDARRAHKPLPDGVACFNGLYLKVTEAVRAGESAVAADARAFLVRLDVVFAELYFLAYEAAAARAWISKAWQPLFEQRNAPHVLPLQFAIAGMNAHINNDLSLALVQVWRELGIDPHADSPAKREFFRVDATLEQVEKEAKGPLCTAFIADVDRDLGRVDDWFALWNVTKARNDAWDRAVVMHDHPNAHWPALWERSVGFLSHLLLAPVLV
jgi:hypothetical protein